MVKELNLGQLCDAIARKGDEISELEARVRELRTEKGTLEDKLMLAMDAAGTEMARGEYATISKSVVEQFQVDDWESLYRYLQRNNAPHLLQRRLSVEAVREEVKRRRGKELPGTSRFEQARLNVRRIS